MQNFHSIVVSLIIGSLVSLTISTVPPFPGESQWPNHTTHGHLPLEQYRRNMGLSFEYKTKLINSELCRFETEQACQSMDESFQIHAKRTLQMVQTSTGKLKVLVILMQFEDHQDRELIESNHVNILFTSESRNDNAIIPTGSVKSYFRINSHGALQIDALVIPWRQVGFNENDCLFGNSGVHKDFQKCFWPILDLLDELHSDSSHPFQWQDFDANLDGFIDSLVVMHSGYGAEWGGIDPNGKVAEERIWSHSMGPQDDRWKSSSFDDIGLGGYCVTSVFQRNEGTWIAGIGILVHELLHSLGLPDLFDLSRTDRRGGVGSYSIMSDAWGQGNNTALPGHLDPWSKIKLGWVTPIPIRSNGTYTMEASEVTSDVYIIDDPYPEGEYLLIEYRRALHYDANIWVEGALIWHIDDNAALNTEAGGPYQGSEWPKNGKHYQVALVQADGLFELEQGLNKGHEQDFFVEGTTLGPGNDGMIYPNTDSYSRGNITPTGITISNFTRNGSTLSFDISGISHTGAATKPTQINPSPIPTAASNKCLISVNLGLCTAHMESLSPTEDCDCWNFCGNGVPQQCCKFGELCVINCHSGSLIAGCTRTSPLSEGDVEFMTPGSDNGFYRPSKPEQDILREEAITDEEDEVSSAVSTLVATTIVSMWLLLSFRLLQF